MEHERGGLHEGVLSQPPLIANDHTKGGQRDQAAEQRDTASEHRDEVGARRDQQGDRRDQAGSQRDRVGQIRDYAGAYRDEAADRRDIAADQRDRAADERDRAADERDQAVDDRDQAGDKSVVPVTERITVNALLRSDGARKQAASDRRQARQDRRSGARERVSAERDRHTAMADREAGADERTFASVDRETALTDRGAGASERTHAGRDRATASEDREESAHERESASIDGLTGVFNRGAGLEILQRDIARAKRTGDPLVLAFLDVDHLKTVNDAGGHAAGDRMLTEVAQTVKAALRPYDLIIRYGGDEFICAIAGLDMPEVTKRFAHVDAALAQAQQHGSITAGIASLQPDDSAAALIARADQALYLKRQHEGSGGASTQ